MATFTENRSGDSPHRLAAALPFCILLLVGLTTCTPELPELPTRPNILLIVMDDLSWSHVGAYGDGAAQTPALDRLAAEGLRFTHVFAPAPSCTATRGALLTGQEMWRLGPGANLSGTLPAELPVYPELLEAAGYYVGFTGKGWGPGHPFPGGRLRNPAGPSYNGPEVAAAKGLGRYDYLADFKTFLAGRPEGQPFCFWIGFSEPHAPWATGLASGYGISQGDIVPPAFLPDSPGIRKSLSHYYGEVAWADERIGELLVALEEAGEAEDTLVVATSDNGISIPRGKRNLYDFGTRVPLIVRWGKHLPRGRRMDQLVSLTDLAPTFLTLAGVAVPDSMTGRVLPGLISRSTAADHPGPRPFVAMGAEGHGAHYPSRAIRTSELLYIRNYEPTRWPQFDLNARRTGSPGDWEESWQGDSAYQLLLRHPDRPEIRNFVDLSFGRRPAEELYDLSGNPDQMVNLAGRTDHEGTRAKLADELTRYLRRTGDPRETIDPVLFEEYEVYDKEWRSRNRALLVEWNRKMIDATPALQLDPTELIAN